MPSTRRIQEMSALAQRIAGAFAANTVPKTAITRHGNVVKIKPIDPAKISATAVTSLPVEK